MDQRFISGIGNIYADEALWDAGINPFNLASSLSKGDISKLLESIKYVLKQGIKNKGTSLGKNLSNFSDINRSFGLNADFLKVYSRVNLPCFRCKALIIRKKINGRSSFFCPSCQT